MSAMGNIADLGNGRNEKGMEKQKKGKIRRREKRMRGRKEIMEDMMKGRRKEHCSTLFAL